MVMIPTEPPYSSTTMAIELCDSWNERRRSSTLLSSGTMGAFLINCSISVLLWIDIFVFSEVEPDRVPGIFQSNILGYA